NATATWCGSTRPAPPVTRPGPANSWWVRSSGCAVSLRPPRYGRSPSTPTNYYTPYATPAPCGRICSVSAWTSTSYRW
ncbi:hypothetical protein, partial [Mycobacterium tuberculosis]|uniref:hypothetical protein n=1 Tax=Mycobacterium tuberculosis TaxID=1773 RepID=UPI003C6E4B0E